MSNPTLKFTLFLIATNFAVSWTFDSHHRIEERSPSPQSATPQYQYPFHVQQQPDQFGGQFTVQGQYGAYDPQQQQAVPTPNQQPQIYQPANQYETYANGNVGDPLNPNVRVIGRPPIIKYLGNSSSCTIASLTGIFASVIIAFATTNFTHLTLK